MDAVALMSNLCEADHYYSHNITFIPRAFFSINRAVLLHFNWNAGTIIEHKLLPTLKIRFVLQFKSHFLLGSFDTWKNRLCVLLLHRFKGNFVFFVMEIWNSVLFYLYSMDGSPRVRSGKTCWKHLAGNFQLTTWEQDIFNAIK